MNRLFPGKTATSVHSARSAAAQRTGAALSNQFTLSSFHLYAQLLIGMAFMLFSHVSTPGYMSLLLLLPPLTGLYLLSLRIAKRRPDAPGRLYKTAEIGLSLCLFIDAQMSLYAFTEIVREMLPDYNSAVITLITLLCVLPSLHNQHGHALPTLARLMRWPLVFGLLFCIPGTLRQGGVQNLFPLLGAGGRRILTGSVWLLSALSAALTPLLIHSPPDGRPLQRRCLRSLLTGLTAAVFTALFAAFLLPFYSLARPDTLGSRLLLPLRINTSIAAWSLLVCAMMFLMLLSLSCALSRCRHLLSHVMKKPVSSAFALLLLPLPALSTDNSTGLLSLFAPLRILCMVLSLLLMLPTAFRKEKKEASIP